MSLPKRLGSVGAGNMAEAILRGLIRSGVSPSQLVAADPDAERRAIVEERLGIRTTPHNAEAALGADLVLIATKPDKLAAATAELPKTDSTPIYLSILAGRRIRDLREHLGDRVVRAMPNTPALIGAGISALAPADGLAEDDVEQAEAVLRAVGHVVRVPESALDAVTGLSGSGPAYVYTFIEALTTAGTREGLPAAVARQLATQTVIGAARMVAEGDEHPAVLRERVTSPAGTTVAGLAALAEGGFEAAVLAAVRAATRRAAELG